MGEFSFGHQSDLEGTTPHISKADPKTHDEASGKREGQTAASESDDRVSPGDRAEAGGPTQVAIASLDGVDGSRWRQ